MIACLIIDKMGANLTAQASTGCKFFSAPFPLNIGKIRKQKTTVDITYQDSF